MTDKSIADLKLAAFRKRKENTNGNSSPHAPTEAAWPTLVSTESTLEGVADSIDEVVEISTDSERDFGCKQMTTGKGEGARRVRRIRRGDLPFETPLQQDTTEHDAAVLCNFPAASTVGCALALKGSEVTEPVGVATFMSLDSSFWVNFPRAATLSTMYVHQMEQKSRMELFSMEQSEFLSFIVFPFVKGCERLMRVCGQEVQTLKCRLVESRNRVQIEGAQRAVLQREVDDISGCASAVSPNNTAELRNLVNVLKTQLKESQSRHEQELKRVNDRRERERNILQEGFRNQISCLEEQIRLLKTSRESEARAVSRIEEDIREMESSIPRESSVRSSKHEQVNHPKTKTVQLRRAQLRQTHSGHSYNFHTSPLPISNAARSPSPGSRSLCPSLNPRHSTVVASIDGSSWRSIYLVVTAQGNCCYGEGMSDASVHLFTLNEVTAVRQGSSRHSQRPLLLSVSYSINRQLDIALGDKSEREFWRQSFKILRVDSSVGSPKQVSTSAAVTDNNTLSRPLDSVASTPSLSSANPAVADADNPTLKRWLESQADNVRRGDLDGSSLTNNEAHALFTEGDDCRAESGSDIAKRKVVQPVSPVPSRPPLGTSANRELGGFTTMSTSSRDRLPPLAPQQKRRSTISGSASTADSLTEDEVNVATPRFPLVPHAEEPIAPVSPSHSSSDGDEGASPPSSDASINLSPELSPVGGPH